MRGARTRSQIHRSSSDSDSDSDSGSGSDNGFTEVQDILLERNPEFLRALQPGHQNEHVSLGMIRDVLAQLERINVVSPPRSDEERTDRKDTEKALRERIAAIEQRDRAAALLGDGWNGLVAEGTPPPRTHSANADEDDDIAAAGDQVGPRHDQGALTWTTSARPHLLPVSPPHNGTPTQQQEQHGEPMTPQPAGTEHPRPALENGGGNVGHGGLVLQPATVGTPVEEGVPPGAPADLAGLVATLQAASPPTHAFGRTATTGVQDAVGGGGAIPGSMTAEDAAFDALLQQLGLLHHATALRDNAIVNADELRDVTENELRDVVPMIGADEMDRVLVWQQQLQLQQQHGRQQ